MFLATQQCILKSKKRALTRASGVMSINPGPLQKPDLVQFAPVRNSKVTKLAATSFSGMWMHTKEK